ncbi:MAG: hydroxyisourate hydrolase [Burkholderiales bacterium]|nr:hydroxyisourate hydrolase [Burkholderiales bacterium]
MGLSTHVLDTMHGTPAAGMAVALYTTHDGQATLVQRLVLNADGRNPAGMLIATPDLRAGTYRLEFDVAAYFKSRGVDLPAGGPPRVLGFVPGRQHYHAAFGGPCEEAGARGRLQKGSQLKKPKPGHTVRTWRMHSLKSALVAGSIGLHSLRATSTTWPAGD